MQVEHSQRQRGDTVSLARSYLEWYSGLKVPAASAGQADGGAH